MHEIGYYTTYTPGRLETEDDRILHEIQERWGDKLENLAKIDLLAALHFIAAILIDRQTAAAMGKADSCVVEGILRGNLDYPPVNFEFLFRIGELSDQNLLGLSQAIAATVKDVTL